MLLLEGDSLRKYNLNQLHWIEYGSLKMSVQANPDGEDFVFVKDDSEKHKDKFYKVADPKQRHELARFFFAKTAPLGSELIEIDYPKIGKGWAYRTLKEGLYLEHLVADANGIIQIPGLPPVYERQIDGKTYVDVPHPDVFNAYIGRKLFLSYTSTQYKRFAGEIPSRTYAEFISNDRFAVANVKSHVHDFMHDIFGHVVVVAAVYEHPLWKKTVYITKGVFALYQSIWNGQLGYYKDRELNEKADDVLMSLGFWEQAANYSGISRANSQEVLDKRIAALADTYLPLISKGEVKLHALEAEVARVLAEEAAKKSK